jgi:DNA-binding transcriptional LysR family regulator
MEDTLDVLLFDRRSRRAQLTPAGEELLRAGEHLLLELDAVAQRVKRVATGWEPQFTIAADAIISRTTLFELCEAFYALGTPTRLRLRSETLSGTLEVVLNGQADLALGVAMTGASSSSLRFEQLGEVTFVFVVAPHHPLAAATHSLTTTELQAHRIVAVADSTQRGGGLSFGLLPGQDVLTVPTMQHKLEAQLRGLGCGSLPLPMVQPYIEAGLLVRKELAQPPRVYQPAYAWRTPHAQRMSSTVSTNGRAMEWWLQQLASRQTRKALLENHQR